MSDLKKCVIWDLDNTLWDGICLEGHVQVKEEVRETIGELDRRGILHSIASRGDKETALQVLKDNRLDAFFLVPRINWLPKSQNIIDISKELHLSLDAIAFVDDDIFELEQVAFMLPDVLTIHSLKAREMPLFPDFSPHEITSEARERRRLYQAELEREKAEHGFKTREDFLLSCGMKLKVRPMQEDDIPRVLELMTRTHQLNTTGLMLGRDEMMGIVRGEVKEEHVVVAELRDRFGWYGIIGTVLAVTAPSMWRLKYLAVSCRVMGRGIERALLATVLHGAREQGFTHLEAEFRETGTNRMMRALYQMAGFRTGDKPDALHVTMFRVDPKNLPDIPRWVEVL
ncbi:MAG: HAD-IIIC family phosphatase [Ignavibacteriales bacterium]|nr:HAD-IIIC family phosphatase [Ignavibacteriales bacterium]